MPDQDSKTNGLVTTLTQLFALYVVYVFLSGWTFFDYYYREFGLDPRWLDLPAQEILVKGFTILLTGGTALWLIYTVMLVGPVLVEESPALRSKTWVRAALPLFLLGILAAVYWASARAGKDEAKIDKGPHTRLVLITFSQRTPGGSTGAQMVGFTGQVLAFRNGVYISMEYPPLITHRTASLYPSSG
jgi:hypothetical protein